MSLATTAPRKQAARLAKPAARYWKGKAPKGVSEIQSDSDEEEEERNDSQEGEEVPLDEQMSAGGDESEEEGMTLHKEIVKTKAINIALKDVSVSKSGQVIVSGREESGRTALEGAPKTEDEESEEESEEEEGSEEEESSEEGESEEEKPKLQFRPVFVPKRARATIAEREQLVEDSEETIKRREQEAEERKKQSHDLVAESIKRELAEKEKEDTVPDVDDTDGLDPEGEFEAWRLRELGRIKAEKEAELEREREREEIERRRALPEEQRMREDMEHAKKTRDDKPQGQQRFLQKYWHKGAFHQDMEVLKKHDYTESTESTVDVSSLPKLMQVKNFGKRGQTKYTHLLDQDTTAGNGGFGGSAPVKSGGLNTQGGGCFSCGGPHLKKVAQTQNPLVKDLPDLETIHGQLGQGPIVMTIEDDMAERKALVRKDTVIDTKTSDPLEMIDLAHVLLHGGTGVTGMTVNATIIEGLGLPRETTRTSGGV
ncbi:hypothetical protein EST38_g7417 [Candolleomyces aberdarensis]|uniref:Micro-fibrillar-associated protein 1 C-terminal domain-containing protein n=1 Tax=Candolleomyces aberdarensis TaxID=2316362 RepID=A0A4V1Q3F9_9AGAR|nr:hypothetical protein EST38_g7417 [Candolleomyces aberdarensis]